MKKQSFAQPEPLASSFAPCNKKKKGNKKHNHNPTYQDDVDINIRQSGFKRSFFI